MIARDGTARAPGADRTGLLWASAVCGLTFVALVAVVSEEPGWLVRFDRSWASRAFAFTRAHDWCESLATAITWLGSTPTVVVVTALAFLACAFRGRLLLGVWLALTVQGSALLNFFVKTEIERTRPSSVGTLIGAHGFAFPSGHTQAATVTYVAVVLVAGWQLLRPPRRPRVVSAAIVVAVVGAVGWSRVFLGVHWPSDVLGGWLLGSAWVTAAAALFLTVAAHRGNRSA